jgi:TonB family protein
MHKALLNFAFAGLILSCGGARHETRTSATVITPPVLLLEIEPSYPEPARKQGLQGVVSLYLLVSDRGNVEQAKVGKSSGHEILDAAAVAYAKALAFEPAIKDGRPTAVWMTWAVNYNLTEAVTQSASLQKKRYVFDAGSAASEVPSGAIRLMPETLYAPKNGYGWTSAPDYSFQRQELSRSRTALTGDGVTAKRLAFRADVPSGKWWLTLWMEAGKEDSSTAALVLGKEKQPLSWHAFRPPAEPRNTIQRIYRMLHRSVQVEQSGLQFQLFGGADSVRVLGFTLHPDPQPTSAQQQALLQRLAAAGRYEATASLEALQADLEKISDDAFAAYWLEQIQLLRRAEQFFEMAGWEWANKQTGLGLFDRLHQVVLLLDGLLDRNDAATSPLYERALRTRGKLLYWLGKERGGPNEISGGQRDLAALYQRYPQDALLAMYCGKKIDLPEACDRLAAAPNAPAWSVAQREALCRLRGIAHWWVNERQAANGEFGGKLGDDVELLRWWTSLIMSGDTVALKGWQRLADGVWESDQIHDGYAREPSDVEHSSEFISDTAPAMALYSDDAKYLDRLRPSARHFEKLWTGVTPNGHRFFRSAWFSSTQIETEPPKNRDVEYNTRAVKAVRYLAWKTGDPEVIRALHEWSLAWVSAAMRTDKGKPAGIIPASVRFPDEAINGDENTWHIANMYWEYFDWAHHAGSMMLDQLLFTFTLTRDERLLQPLFAALDLVKSCEGAGDNGRSSQAGSAAWAAAKLRDESAFWSVVEQWRFLSGEARYDDLIARYGTPYARYRLTGDEARLWEGLQVLLEATRYNTPLLTSEALHTDRVYAPGADHLKAMLTSDGMPESMSPYYAVSWENTGDDFTALVTDTGRERLGVKIFSHAAIERTARMRLWQLAPGAYRMKSQTEKNVVDEMTIDVNARGERVEVTLPAQMLIKITFERAD